MFSLHNLPASSFCSLRFQSIIKIRSLLQKVSIRNAVARIMYPSRFGPLVDPFCHTINRISTTRIDLDIQMRIVVEFLKILQDLLQRQDDRCDFGTLIYSRRIYRAGSCPLIRFLVFFLGNGGSRSYSSRLSITPIPASMNEAFKIGCSL